MGLTLLRRDESFIACRDYFLAGPCVAACQNPDAPGQGSLIMTADLFDGSDSNAGTMQWRSTDGGESFFEEGLMERSYQCDFNGSMIKSGYGGSVLDERTGALVYFASDTFWDRGDYLSIKKCRRLYYRISFDNGKSWTDKHYLIQQGADAASRPYDADYYMDDALYGRNKAAIVGASVLRGADGALLVGVQTQIADGQGELVEPAGFMFMKCGALRGHWDEKKLDYTWEFGAYAQVEPAESSRGVYEPVFARRKDGGVLMVMRGSNMKFRDSIPGTKFYSVSRDDGRSWTKPARLTWDDGSTAFSSSCIPKLLQHSGGKTYLIGVLNEENPDGNLPRYPLCIVELDTESCVLRKDTVMVIDGARPHHLAQASQTKNVVDYSNHFVYEDSRERIVVLAPYRPDLRAYRSVLNRYLIEVD